MNTPGEDLLNSLDLLKNQLNILSNRLNNSGTERTAGLLDLMGKDCEFYRKSLDIFVRKDYIDLRNLIEKCHELFRIIEG